MTIRRQLVRAAVAAVIALATMVAGATTASAADPWDEVTVQLNAPTESSPNGSVVARNAGPGTWWTRLVVTHADLTQQEQSRQLVPGEQISIPFTLECGQLMQWQLEVLTGPDGDILSDDFGGDTRLCAPGTLAASAPERVLDTRDGTGVPRGMVPANGSVTLDVDGGDGFLFVDAAAVVLNVTTTAVTRTGNITVYPEGTTMPTVSNLNLRPGEDVANLVTVKIGASGRVVLKNNSGAALHLIADFAGYYFDGPAQDRGAFVTLSPSRILDTRSGSGAPKAKVAPSGVLALQVKGRGGVPSTANVGAVVMNVTSTAVPTTGNVTAYPNGTAAPSASNLNLMPGKDVPNLVTVKLGSDGKVALKNNSRGSIHLIADVAGYYIGGTPTLSGTFTPLNPTRLMDTRSSLGAAGPVAARGTATVTVGGRGGVPTSASAVVMNSTVTQPKTYGNITAYPTGASKPSSSTLNFKGGQDIPNLTLVKLGTSGRVNYANNSTGSVQLIADVAGWFRR